MARFLLLHGACHGGWCWDAVASLLREEGHDAIAPDLPCDDTGAGLEEYATVAMSALDGDIDDVVAVGHSLGALVVPLVAERLPARRAVFVAGIVGMPNASLAKLADEDADRDGPLGPDDVETDDAGRFRFSAAGARRVLFHDCRAEDADSAIARLRFQRSLWNEVATFRSWPEEVVSIVCTEDRVVNRAWAERTARERLGVEPVLLAGGHSPFLSRPADLAAALTAGVDPPR